MTMIKLSTIFLLVLLAAFFYLPFSGRATAMESKSIGQKMTRHIKASPDERARSSRLACLPEGLKLTDVVSYRDKRKGSDEQTTVGEKLIELQARCRKGLLVDSKGREIKFFKFSCFGNPPSDHEEIAQREREELDKLQKDYTVIVLDCDPLIS
jgi:hypothetical protein